MICLDWLTLTKCYLNTFARQIAVYKHKTNRNVNTFLTVIVLYFSLPLFQNISKTKVKRRVNISGSHIQQISKKVE